MQVVTRSLTQRLEAAEARCWYRPYAELSRLPGNPYGLEVRRFGDVWLYTCTAFPEAGFANKIFCAGGADIEQIDQALSFARARGVKTSVEIAPGIADGTLLGHMAKLGLTAQVFCSVLYGAPAPGTSPRDSSSQPSGLQIRVAETEEDVALVVRLHREGMSISDRGAAFFRDLALAAHRIPQFRHYIAEVDGQPAAEAWLFAEQGVGCLVSGATLPAFRGRGLQTALIQRRIADALAAGCDLVCSQTDPVTVSQHNLERAGLRIAYTKMEFHPAP